MRGPFVQQRKNDEEETEKAPFLVVQKIRDAILDETFEPGERLPEEQLGKMFNVSRSPVREALLALEKEGTVVMEPFKGATVKPLSPEEALDIAELRLSLITLAAKPAYRHLSLTDFDLAYGLAKQMTRSNSAKEYFEYDRRFWDIIFEKAQRPILGEVSARGLRLRTYTSSARSTLSALRRQSANTRASSMAIQPPSPMCGGPACAASPIRTTRPRYHSSSSTHSIGPTMSCSPHRRAARYAGTGSPNPAKRRRKRSRRPANGSFSRLPSTAPKP